MSHFSRWEPDFHKKSRGHLVGSIGGECDSWGREFEFEPHTGCGNYLKLKSEKRKSQRKLLRGRYLGQHLKDGEELALLQKIYVFYESFK